MKDNTVKIYDNVLKSFLHYKCILNNICVYQTSLYYELSH